MSSTDTDKAAALLQLLASDDAAQRAQAEQLLQSISWPMLMEMARLKGWELVRPPRGGRYGYFRTAIRVGGHVKTWQIPVEWWQHNMEVHSGLGLELLRRFDRATVNIAMELLKQHHLFQPHSYDLPNYA